MSLCSFFFLPPLWSAAWRKFGVKLLSNHGLILTASNAAFSLVTIFKIRRTQPLKVRVAEVEMFHQAECCEYYIFFLVHFASYTYFTKVRISLAERMQGTQPHQGFVYHEPCQHPLQYGYRDRRWALGGKRKNTTHCYYVSVTGNQHAFLFSLHI